MKLAEQIGDKKYQSDISDAVQYACHAAESIPEFQAGNAAESSEEFRYHIGCQRSLSGRGQRLGPCGKVMSYKYLQ